MNKIHLGSRRFYLQNPRPIVDFSQRFRFGISSLSFEAIGGFGAVKLLIDFIVLANL